MWGLVPFVLVTIAAWQVVRRYRSSAVERTDTLFVAATIAAALGYLLMSATETIILEEIPNAFFAVILGSAAGRLDSLCRGRIPLSVPWDSRDRLGTNPTGEPTFAGTTDRIDA